VAAVTCGGAGVSAAFRQRGCALQRREQRTAGSSPGSTWCSRVTSSSAALALVTTCGGGEQRSGQHGDGRNAAVP
jgi:hypothetical protein